MPKFPVNPTGITNGTGLLNAGYDLFDTLGKQDATLRESGTAIANFVAAFTAFGAKHPVVVKISGVAAIAGGAGDANANLVLLKKKGVSGFRRRNERGSWSRVRWCCDGRRRCDI
jgi:hypothetical protein